MRESTEHTENDRATQAGGRPADAGDETSRIFLVAGGAVEPLEDVALDDMPRLLADVRRQDRFVWLHLVEPQEQTVQRARDVLGIHPTAAADVVSRLQQPKVQMLDDHLFVMLWNVLHRPDDTLVLGDTFLYIGDGWLLTVQRGNGGELRDLPELLGGAQSDSRSDTMPAAHVIMAQIVDGYAQAAARVETALEELEDQVFSEEGHEDYRRIYRVRKDIGRIDRAVSSIAAALKESTRHLETIEVGREPVLPYLHDCSMTPQERPRSSATRARASTRS